MAAFIALIDGNAEYVACVLGSTTNMWPKQLKRTVARFMSSAEQRLLFGDRVIDLTALRPCSARSARSAAFFFFF